MKKTVFIIISIFLAVACGGPEKPKKLLSQQDMENILYDMTVLQSIRSFTPQTLTDNGVDPAAYIYKKYKIDSLTLAQNQMYYAKDIKAYKKIQDNVTARLKQDKEKLTGKKDGDKTTNTGTTAPAENGNTTESELTPEQKAAMKHKRDSVRDASQLKLRQAPLHKIKPQ